MQTFVIRGRVRSIRYLYGNVMSCWFWNDSDQKKLQKSEADPRSALQCGRRSTVRRRCDDATMRRCDDATIRSFFGEILKIDPFLVNTPYHMLIGRFSEWRLAVGGSRGPPRVAAFSHEQIRPEFGIVLPVLRSEFLTQPANFRSSSQAGLGSFGVRKTH